MCCCLAVNTVALIQGSNFVLLFEVGEVGNEDVKDELHKTIRIDYLMDLWLAQRLANNLHTIVEKPAVENTRQGRSVLFAPELGFCQGDFPLARRYVGNQHPCALACMTPDVLVNVAEGEIKAVYLDVTRVVRKVCDVASK